VALAGARHLDYKALAAVARLARPNVANGVRMTKLKSKRAAAKRFRFTSTGKALRNHAHHRHQLTHKAQKVKVGQRGTTVVAAADSPMIKRMLPYG
jgi:large subunit ribosomal protein L35